MGRQVVCGRRSAVVLGLCVHGQVAAHDIGVYVIMTQV